MLEAYREGCKMGNVEPKVTIGLPTYNRAKLLLRCVNSVLNQTYKNWELMISDDNSSDATPEVAQSLTELDGRIRYFRQDKRVFLPKNRNTICSLAKSSLIFFIEDDLFLHRDCLTNLVQAYKESSSWRKVGAVTPRMITVGDSTAESDAGVVITISKWTGLIQGNFDIGCNERKKIVAGHSCSLISKEAWKEVGGYEENRYRGTNLREETDFYFRIGQKGYEIFFEPKALTYHLKHDVGGCRYSSRLRDGYFFARNHVFFLFRFYKLRSAYMVPLFALYLAYKVMLCTVLRRAKK